MLPDGVAIVTDTAVDPWAFVSSADELRALLVAACAGPGVRSVAEDLGRLPVRT
jgi:hypothetical protein